MFKCNGYVKQAQRVNEKNEKYCNGRMHAVLNKSPTITCLAKQTNKQTKQQQQQQQQQTTYRRTHS